MVELHIGRLAPAILFEDDSSENGGDHEADAPTRPNKVDRVNTHLENDDDDDGDDGDDDGNENLTPTLLAK